MVASWTKGTKPTTKTDLVLGVIFEALAGAVIGNDLTASSLAGIVLELLDSTSSVGPSLMAHKIETDSYT